MLIRKSRQGEHLCGRIYIWDETWVTWWRKRVSSCWIKRQQWMNVGCRDDSICRWLGRQGNRETLRLEWFHDSDIAIWERRRFLKGWVNQEFVLFVGDCFNYLLDIQKESSKPLTRKPIAASSSAIAPFHDAVKLWLSPYPWSYAPLAWEGRPLRGGCWWEGPSQETRTLGCVEVEGKTTAYTWSILLENQFYSKYWGGNGISIETQPQINYGVE